MTVRRFNAFGWENLPVLSYKEGGPYKDVTRQILFEGAESLPVQWRYFEVQPGGHSTLERHEHIHWVLILRGRGACLVGDEITDIAEHDLVEIRAMQWHQFRAAEDAPLGFLCLVAADRDRPQLPSEDDLTALRQNAKIAEFIRS
ncbi:MAG: cupin domain-containing protein [Acetobacteraceae bacterium]|jgi:mannose-6-phosphate isomerase-like protein (cupin superfamily)|nr:cupin domain-containing protein [Acetobacteraceae bacterium]